MSGTKPTGRPLALVRGGRDAAEDELDRLLDWFVAPAADPRLGGVIAAAAARTAQLPALAATPPRLRASWPHAAWLAASVVCGIIVGANGYLPATPSSSADIVELAQLTDDPSSLEEW